MVKLALHELRSADKYNRKASTDDFICKLRAPTLRKTSEGGTIAISRGFANSCLWREALGKNASHGGFELRSGKSSTKRGVRQLPVSRFYCTGRCPVSSRAFQKPRGRRPRLVGDHRAGQHAGDFLSPDFPFENRDPRGDAAAWTGGSLGDAEMTSRAGRDLRRMSHGEHLYASREPRQPLAHGIGHRTAGSRIDFIKDKCWSRALLGKNHFQRQHETGKLAAGGDFQQRARLCSGIGLHPKLDLIVPIRAFQLEAEFGCKMGAFEFEWREFGGHFGIERGGGFLARLRQRPGRRRIGGLRNLGLSR